MNIDQSRARFEKAHSDFALNRNVQTGEYCDFVESRWLGWQAALSQKSANASELHDTFFELNLGNYGDEEVRKQQEWAFKALEFISQQAPRTSDAAVQITIGWEPCNPACDVEFNGYLRAGCDCANAIAARASQELSKPDVTLINEGNMLSKEKYSDIVSDGGLDMRDREPVQPSCEVVGYEQFRKQCADACMQATPDREMKRAIGDAAHYVACNKAIMEIPLPAQPNSRYESREDIIQRIVNEAEAKEPHSQWLARQQKKSNATHKAIEALRAERDALKEQLSSIKSAISDDGMAITFQSMGQYRTSLLRLCK